MAILYTAPILLFSFLGQQTGALQVTADSPCASVCLDSPTQDSSNPDASHSTGSEIACLDASFSSTKAGRKFEACVGCLQNSTFYSDDDGNDQGAFIYNLRFALGSCLFNFENATDEFNTSCSTDTSCGPLRDAIQDGSLLPTPKSQYAYCAADHNSLLGSSLPKCIECLRNGGKQVYLSNFLTALKAGCVEQPPGGTSIGLDGTVFSTIPVNITSPGDSPGAPTRKKGDATMSRDSIIGISVALGVLVLITLITIVVCFCKWQKLKSRRSLGSPLDSRFGATNITSPNTGAYGNPYASPPIHVGFNHDMSNLSAKERAVMAGRNIGFISKEQISEPKPHSTWQDAHAHLAAQPHVYTPTEIPTHHAYIPAHHSDGSESQSNTPLHSAKSSPAYPPSRTSPNYPPQGTGTAIKYLSPTQEAQSQSTCLNPTPSPLLNTRLNKLSQTLSRNLGIGHNTLNSAVHGNHITDGPSTISGPMIQHGGRFDFELAERERTQKEKKEEVERQVTRRTNWTPENEVSEEQWPGNY